VRPPRHPQIGEERELLGVKPEGRVTSEEGRNAEEPESTGHTKL
jgi:hypothetical protein